MISGSTKTYAVLGRPVAHSRSPELHNAWFAAHGIDARYLALEVPELQESHIGQAVRTLGLAGANITAPLKSAVVAQVDRLEPDAEAAGAVNTLWWDGDRLVGANTDGEGLLLALTAAGIDVAGRNVTILGAGGAARSIAIALGRRPIDGLRILNRTRAHAQSAARAVGRAVPGRHVSVGGLTAEELSGSDLVVVCTARGAPDLSPEDPDLLGAGAVWCDINYGAGPSPGLGWEMLRWQAALAFERWTGVRPRPPEAGAPC